MPEDSVEDRKDDPRLTALDQITRHAFSTGAPFACERRHRLENYRHDMQYAMLKKKESRK